MKLTDHHILVTGGANGVGAAVVRDAALCGAEVSFVDIDAAAGETLFQEMLSVGHRVSFAPVDVGDFGALEHAYQGFVEQFGNVTGIVNCASVRANVDPVDMTDEDWDAVFSVDLKSIWHTAKLALPAMRIAQKGSIVNIRSNRAQPTESMFFPYGAASAAAMGLTRNLGVDEGRCNIRANMLSYGYCVPLRNLAKVATFLLSDDASFVNCSDWVVDSESIARSA